MPNRPALSEGWWHAALLIFGAAACAGAPAARPISVVRDSQGVVIVTNRDVGWTRSKPWTVRSVPLLTVGAETGADDYRFNGIVALVSLPDGGLAVADGSNSIRRYDESGHYVSTIGRDGDGPGEFRTISLLRLFGDDSLIVWDMALRRITIISTSGRVGRMSGGPSIPGFFFAVDLFADGSLLGLHAPGLDLRGATPGLVSTPLNVLRYDARTLALDTIARVRGGTAVVEGGAHPRIVSVPFSPDPLAAALGSNVYCGSGYSFEIRMYGDTGGLRRVVRLERPNPPLTRRRIRDFIARQAGGAKTDDGRREIEASLSKLPYPKFLPAFDGLVTDPIGNLWLSQNPAGPREPTTWTVFDPGGHLLGDVRTPAGFSVFEIGADRLLGVSRDSLGVEQVQMLRLAKGG